MRKVFLFFAVLSLTIILIEPLHSLPNFKWSGVAYDYNGQVIVSQVRNVQVRINDGYNLSTETFSDVAIDAFGMFTVEVGTGVGTNLGSISMQASTTICVDIWDNDMWVVVYCSPLTLSYSENNRCKYICGGLSNNYPYVDVCAYGTLFQAVQDFRYQNKTLLVSCEIPLGGNVYIPSNIQLLFSRDGKIIKDVGSLTIGGPFSAGLFEVFYGFSPGDVTFGPGSVTEVYPEWWGACVRRNQQDTINTFCPDEVAVRINQNAFQCAIDAFDNIVISKGTYIVDGVILRGYGKILRGVSPENSILKGIRAGSILKNDDSQPYLRFRIRDFAMYSDSGTGCYGLFTSIQSNVNETEISNIYGHTDKALIDIENGFNNYLFNVQASSYSDHAIILTGDMTTLINCYVHTCNSPSKAGYRIYSGSPVLIGCVGVDIADIWGIFGNDNPLAYCNPSFINCNIEAVKCIGLDFYNGSFGSYIRTSFLGPDSSRACSPDGVIAIRYQGGTHASFSNDIGDVYFNTAPGRAPWKNNHPIHSLGKPFIPVRVDANDDPSYYFYDYSSSSSIKVDGIDALYTYLDHGLKLTNVNYMKLGNKRHLFGTSPPNSRPPDDPETGVWEVGDIIFNTNPSPNGYIGWVCTAGGYPGTWKGFGRIEQ